MRASIVRCVIRALVLVVAILPLPALAREWSDYTGTFKVNGEVVAYDGKTVRLTLDLAQRSTCPSPN